MLRRSCSTSKSGLRDNGSASRLGEWGSALGSTVLRGGLVGKGRLVFCVVVAVVMVVSGGLPAASAAPAMTHAGPAVARVRAKVLSKVASQAGTGADGISLYHGVSADSGLVAGPDGAVWFLNPGDSIGRVAADGEITIYPDPDRSMNLFTGNVSGLTVGPDGALWFTNNLTGSVGRMTTDGSVSSYSVVTSTTPFPRPEGITTGPDGALWFTNGTSIGRITTGGAVSYYTGTGISVAEGITVGPDGALWFTNYGNNSIGRITTGGTVTNYPDANIDGPTSIARGPDGALWFTNSLGNSIGRITTAGSVSKFTDPTLESPQDITAGSDGALWFTNFDGNAIGRITSGGVITEYKSSGTTGALGITAGPDGALWFSSGGAIGRITTAGVVTGRFSGLGIDGASSITTGPDGALWFTNSNLNTIGRITTDGVVTHYTAPGVLFPEHITVGPDGSLWFLNNDFSVGRITTTGVITVYQLSGVGPVNEFTSITAGPDGAMWLINSSNSSIVRMTTAGVVTNDYSGPGISINPAAGVITGGPDGALWFSNSNDSIGRITTTGAVSDYTDPSFTGLTDITAGPDGALWFTSITSQGGSIGRLSTAGVVTNTFTGPDVNEPGSIAAGPDGALWFSTESGAIGRITTSGMVSTFTDLSNRGAANGGGILPDFPAALTAGPDGRVWFAGDDVVGSVTTAGVAACTNCLETFATTLVGLLGEARGANSIVAGPDGALWFTNYGENSIGRITPDGTITYFTDPTINGPAGITVGPDGALWFTNYNLVISNGSVTTGSIGRITTAGVISNYTDPTIDIPGAITAGPDGALWFTNDGGNGSIGRITTSGAVSNYTDPGIDDPQGITAGPDGALWFTNFGSVGRITTSGTVSYVTDPSFNLQEITSITTGPDGALWAGVGDSIARITTNGNVTIVTSPDLTSPSSLTTGPDGTLWFTSSANCAIGRVGSDGSVGCVLGDQGTQSTSQFWALSAGPDGALWYLAPGSGLGTNPNFADIGRLPVPPGAPVIGTASAGDGQAVVSFSPPASDGGSPVIAYTVVATDMTEGSRGGQTANGTTSPITVRGLTPGDSYLFTVAATNAVGVGPLSGASNQVTPTTGPTSPRVVTTALPGDLYNTPYSYTLEASGGTAPYAWSISSGSLPNRLSLDPSTGVISGNPLTVGTFPITVKVTDTNGQIDSQALTLVVDQAASSTQASIPSAASTGATTTLSATVTAAVGTPTGTVTFTAGGITLCTTGPLVAGVGSCQATLSQAGLSTITATYSGDTDFTGSWTSALTRTAGPASASVSTMTALPTSVPADGVSAATVTVTLKDAGGNPVAGKTVSLAQGPGTHARISAPSGPSDANGHVTFTITDTSAETVITTATDSSDTLILTQTASVSFVAVAADGCYSSLTPARVLDTRNGTGGTTGPVGPGQTVKLKVLGAGGVPAAGVEAVVLNVTVTQASASGYVTVYPDGVTRPTASNLNFVAGQTIPNLVVAPVGGTARSTCTTGPPARCS